jgi:acyl-CoA reductase-like NAD-dependent aldehyde dehydrogenase
VSMLNELVARSRTAQVDWARLPIKERLRPLRSLRHRLVADCEALCAATARDIGKAPEETLGGDVLPLADACRFLEREAGRILRPRRVPGRQRPLWLWGVHDTVQRRPRGVVGIIGTWNYPLLLNGVQIIQALTAGNAVVWKPSEVAPASAAALHDLLREAGYPADLLVVLEATREAGPALLEADVDHVVFTGSADTGRVIARRLGERLISSTLELSGCDAQFVLDDADVFLAARSAWFAAMVNRGQTCIAARRSFVQRPIYPLFCSALRDLASQAGPQRLALASQARQADRLVQEALAGGGKLLLERQTGTDGKEAIAEEVCPAVVVDARPEMALCREASFAPLLAVLPFDTVDEALRLEAQCPYALGASVFTRSPARGEELAASLRAGMVTINDAIVPTAHPGTPFGGRGASGWGSTQGAEGLLEMTVPQVVSRRWGGFRLHLDWAVGKGAAQVEVLRALLQGSHAPSWGERCRAWWYLLRWLVRRE